MEDAQTQFLRRLLASGEDNRVKKRLLLVGEQNPHGADPRFALYPLPPNGSGGRLARILGLEPLEYLRSANRVNLCYDEWDWDEARETATKIVKNYTFDRCGVVILGRKAERAFGWRHSRYEVHRVSSNLHMLAMPHPSGLCREWNDEKNVERARAAWWKLWHLLTR